MMININDYLKNTPTRYDDTAYTSFLKVVLTPLLPNAIHITGTNGKGSTARYLAKTLEHNGYRVGLFVSPHLVRFNELASINGMEISDEYIASQIFKYDELFKKYALSAFEIITFISLTYFAESNVDVTIVEVGMGGLKDATNIFTPILSVITNIGLDHIKELGPTISDIATHKAGIIKPGVPVLVGPMNKDALAVIKKAALSKKAPLKEFAPSVTILKRYLDKTKIMLNEREYMLGSGAAYETINANLAFEVLRFLKGAGFKVSLKSFKEALKEQTYPGRYSVVSKNPAVIVDGAHNIHALRALINDVSRQKRNLKIIYATFADKDYVGALDLLSLTKAEVLLTTFPHPRALTTFSDERFPFIFDYTAAIKQSLRTLGPKDLLLIVGSLYFATMVTNEFSGGLYAL